MIENRLGAAAYRVAIDIGGTFTDIVVQDARTGEVKTGKVLSTRADPAQAVLTALGRFVPVAADIGFLVHGTTVGLNAVLERRGAKTALVTTAGFEHVYLIGGNDRRDIFALRYRKPKPLLDSEQIYPVPERLDAQGRVQRRLDTAALDAVVTEARTRNFQAIAVCTLFSYLNPEHEQAIAAYLRDRLDIPVVLSHQVSPEWREYARTSTTVMTAYIAPVIERYLATLTGRLDGEVSVPLHVMQSNGGVMSATMARREPIQTLLSGPVGGAIGARAISKRLGRTNVICVDMGGTSFDVSLIVDGEPTISTETELDGLPLQMTAVDITGIGAGGGSIAWIEGSALRVGPHSAGADPGPVCYGRGGTQPTVTDANLVLGRVHARRFAGGGMELRLDDARSALACLGRSLGMTLERTAHGVLDIVNGAMADAIRTQTVKRGIDPRDFTLIAFGGAGPMHAAAIAKELDITEVVIPAHPGTFSAWGMLQTDIRHDLRRTYFRPLHSLDVDDMNQQFLLLEQEGRILLRRQGISEDRTRVSRMADLRYTGQEYSMTVPLPAVGVDVDVMKAEFDQMYKTRYGHANAEAPAEIVKLRLTVTGELDRPDTPTPGPVADAAPAVRRVSFDGEWHDTTIIGRSEIAPDQVIAGPAIIEEPTATTIVPPAWHAQHGPGGHLLLSQVGGPA